MGSTITPKVIMRRAAVLPASLFFLVLLHDKYTKLSSALDVGPVNSNFCLNSAQVTVCPNPPTFDMVNLQAFAGKWYEIGSNARFKLARENGLACNSANYTVISTAPNVWGLTQSNLSIVDTGVKALGPLGEHGVMQISTASDGICQNAREICRLMKGSSQLGQALTQMAATTGRLLMLHGPEAAQLAKASTNIGDAISSINSALDGLSRNITRIQFLDAQLSQANGSVQDNLQKLNNLTMQTGIVQDAIQQAVKVIAFARGIVTQAADINFTVLVTTKLLFAGGLDMPVTAVPDLGKVMFLLAGAEQDIIAQAAQIQLALFGMNAVSSLIAIDKTTPGSGGVASFTGSAVQNSTSAGRLTATVQGTTAPFLILGVDGWANDGYNAALVYSCTPVTNGHFKQGLFVIARTPTLDQNVVDRLLDIAKFNGIQTTCDDPFLYTVQQSPFCFPSPPPRLAVHVHDAP